MVAFNAYLRDGLKQREYIKQLGIKEQKHYEAAFTSSPLPSAVTAVANSGCTAAI